MDNIKRPRHSSLTPDPSFKACLIEPVMPVPNQGWRFCPAIKDDTLQRNLDAFWALQRNEMENSTGLHRRSPLSLARIKRVMKSDPNVKMVSSDTPVILAKASEMLIMELALRSWMYTRAASRHIISASDVSQAIRNSELHNYLVDLVRLVPPSVRHQTVVPECALPQQVSPPPNANVPDEKAPIDMDQIQKDGVMSNRFIEIEDFDLDLDFQ